VEPLSGDVVDVGGQQRGVGGEAKGDEDGVGGEAGRALPCDPRGGCSKFLCRLNFQGVVWLF